MANYCVDVFITIDALNELGIEYEDDSIWILDDFDYHAISTESCSVPTIIHSDHYINLTLSDDNTIIFDESVI